jgi:nucleotide-binding universal stress UspA family protein
LKRIVWSIDPFDTSTELKKGYHAVLERLVDTGIKWIDPITVSRERDWGLSPSAATLKIAKQTLEKVCSQWLKEFENLHPSRCKILFEPNGSATRAVKEVIAFSSAKSADGILVGTHARRGVARALLGSFTESLVVLSKIPVLVLNPDSRIHREGPVVFCTDCGASPRTLAHAIATAKRLGTGLVFLTVLDESRRLAEFASQLAVVGAPMSVVAPPEQDLERSKSWFESALRAAKKEGVKAQCVSLNSTRGIAHHALEYLESHPPACIVVSARSGRFASTLLGSVTRQLIRGAPCPVWVVKG